MVGAFSGAAHLRETAVIWRPGVDGVVSDIPFFAALGLGAREEQTSAFHATAFDVLGDDRLRSRGSWEVKLDRSGAVGQ